MRSNVAVFFRRFKIWHSEVCIDFHTLMGPGDMVQKVQGSRVRRVQRSEHPRERIPLPTWQQDLGEKASKRAKDNTDGKAGEGPW